MIMNEIKLNHFILPKFLQCQVTGTGFFIIQVDGFRLGFGIVVDLEEGNEEVAFESFLLAEELYLLVVELFYLGDAFYAVCGSKFVVVLLFGSGLVHVVWEGVLSSLFDVAVDKTQTEFSKKEQLFLICDSIHIINQIQKLRRYHINRLRSIRSQLLIALILMYQLLYINSAPLVLKRRQYLRKLRVIRVQRDLRYADIG